MPLIVGLVLLAATLLWILSDWQVRTLRAVAVLTAASVLGIAIGYGLPAPWGYLIGSAVAVAVALPVLTHHSAVSALSTADAAMVTRLGKIENLLVSASDRVRRGHGGLEEFRKAIVQVRANLDAIEPPDREWAGILRAVRKEIDATLAVARGQSGVSAGELGRRRAFIRHAYRDLVRRRSRRWSWLPR